MYESYWNVRQFRDYYTIDVFVEAKKKLENVTMLTESWPKGLSKNLCCVKIREPGQPKR